MDQKTFEANINIHIAGLYPQETLPGVIEIAPGENWRIICENGEPVAVCRFREYGIVSDKLSENAWNVALGRGRCLFTATWEDVQDLARWVLQYNALVLADEVNFCAPHVSRTFDQVASQLRANLLVQIGSKVDQIVNK